ncbi:unnamed protein product, partial [Medioppia subpectinata]
MYSKFIHQGLVGHNRIIGRTGGHVVHGGGHLVHGGVGHVGVGHVGLVAAAPAVHLGHAFRTHAVAAAPAFAVAAAPAIHAAPIGLAFGGHSFGHGFRQGHVGHVQNIGPVTAAVETRRTHQVIDVPTSQDVIQPSTLIIEPNILPVNIEFRSQSSPVNVNQ